MRGALWWFGNVVGWVGLGVIPLSLGGAWLNQVTAPSCGPGADHLCGEGVGLGWVAGGAFALVGFPACGVGFMIRSFAEPKR